MPPTEMTFGRAIATARKEKGLSQKDLAALILKEDGTAISPQYLNDIEHNGVFVLRTNTDLDPLAAMLRYKQLWTVEATFRTAKHLLATRPIFHKLDETIRGHVFCSFLALVLKSELEHRIAALGRDGSWPEILADLDSLTETEIVHEATYPPLGGHPVSRR